jgi:transcriptional regulator
MYLPKLNAETDPEVIDRFIRDHGFATLITTTGATPEVTHLPIELVKADAGERVLEGHLARANPQWHDLAAGGRALVIFSGAHSYISPTWYDQENVPTWNYLVVHASGTPTLVTDHAGLRDMLVRLSSHYEPEGSPPPRFAVESMTPAHYEKEASGIVGFRIAVDTIQAKFKLSQNRHDADHARIVLKLRERGDENAVQVADAMESQRVSERES